MTEKPTNLSVWSGDTEKLISMSHWETEDDMSLWISQNFCRLFTPSESMNFLFETLECYYRFMEKKIEEAFKTSLKGRVKIGKVNVIYNRFNCSNFIFTIDSN